MNLNELFNSPFSQQIKKPQSAGSRGLSMSKKKPGKRYFDQLAKESEVLDKKPSTKENY